MRGCLYKLLNHEIGAPWKKLFLVNHTQESKQASSEKQEVYQDLPDDFLPL
jgi:hypothetical protein